MDKIIKINNLKELRLIPKGTIIWSIKNQTNLITTQDEIIEIVSNSCFNNHYIFAKLKQLIFNVPGYFPALIDKGLDEWKIEYNKTLPYTIPRNS